MQNRFIIPVVLLILSIAMLWRFAIPFKTIAVDPIQEELSVLQTAYDKALKQSTFDSLRQRKNKISTRQQEILKTYIPENLHSGKLIYNLSQVALQNRLTVKNIQYSIVDEGKDRRKDGDPRKLQIEFQIDGNYLDFINWMTQIERSDVLIDTESVRGNRLNNNVEKISFTVKMLTYGQNIF
jgi:Tfp pilus assembly protein PilO